MSNLLQKVIVEVDGRIDGLQQKLDVAGKSVSGFSDKVGGITGGMGGLDNALGNAGARLSGFSSALASTGVAAGVLGVAMGALAAESVRMAAEIETSMNRVQSALSLEGGELAELRAEARSLSTTFGVAQADVTRLFESIAEGGPGSAEGLRATARAAMELAAITGKDAGGLAAGLDQVIDAFGLASEQAQEVSAALFGITRGRVPLDDLFATLAKLAPTAQATGISFKELAAASVGLLDAGIPARQVSAELVRLAESGERGRAMIRDLAGDARDAAADQKVYDDALQRNAESAETLARSLREQLNNELISLGEQLLPPATHGLGLLNDAMATAAATATLLGGAVKRIADETPEWLVEKLRNVATLNPLSATLLVGRSLRAEQLSGGNADGAGGAPVRVPGVVVNTPAAEDPTVARLNAIREATKHLATTSTAELRAFLAELDKIRTGDGAKGSRLDATNLGVDIARELEKRGQEATRKAQDAQKQFERNAEQFAQRTAAMVVQLTNAVSGSYRNSIKQLNDDFDRLSKEGKLDEATIRSYQEAAAGLNLAAFAAEQAAAQQRAYKDATEQSTEQAGAAIDDFTRSVSQIVANGMALGGLFAIPDADVRRLVDMERGLQAIVKSESVGNVERERAKELLGSIRSLIKDIYGTGDGKNAPGVPDADSLEKALQGLARAGRALLDAASAAGVLDAQLVNALGSAINLADNIGSLSGLAEKAGGFEKLFSTGKGVASALPAVGAIAASLLNLGVLGARAFGGNEPTADERADIEARKENTRALRELSETLGAADIANTGERRGRSVAVAQSVLDEVARRTREFEEQERQRAEVEGQSYVAAGPPTFNMGDLLARELARAGISFAEFQEQAKRLGITITKTGEGIGEVVKAAAAAGIAFQQLDADTEILALSAAERFRGVLAIYASLDNGVADAARDTARTIQREYDLTTQEGRDAARAFVQDQYRLKRITAESAGQLLDGIDAISDEVLAAAEKAADTAARIIEEVFQRLATALRRVDLDRELLGLSPEQVIEQTIGAYLREAPEGMRQLFEGVLDGIDLATEEGRRTAKERVQGIYRQLLAGGLDDSEAEIAQGLLGILGLIDTFGDDLLREAEELEAKAAAARDRRLRRSEQRATLGDEDSIGRFNRLVQDYVKEFPELERLFSGLNLRTTEGVRVARERLTAFFDTIGEGEQFDPIIDAILTLDGAAEQAGASIQDTAKALRDAAAAASAARLELLKERNAKLGIPAGLSFDQALVLAGKNPALGQYLLGVRDPAGVQAAYEQWLAYTLDPARLDQYTPEQLEQVQADMDYWEGLLGFIPRAFDANVRAESAQSQTVVDDVERIQERTANALLDVERSQLVVQTRMEQHLADLLLAAGIGMPSPVVLPPLLPSAGGRWSATTHADGSGAAGDAGPTSFRITTDATLRLVGGTGDVAAFLAANGTLAAEAEALFAEAFERRVEQAVTRALLRQRAAKGDITSTV